jgi:hypothetical protein
MQVTRKRSVGRPKRDDRGTDRAAPDGEAESGSSVAERREKLLQRIG